MHRLPRLAFALASLPLALHAQNPATLLVDDLSNGASSAGGPSFDLVGGHTVQFTAGGDPGELVLLFLSALPPGPNPPQLGGVTLNFNPAEFFLLANGLGDPSAVLDAAGSWSLATTAPNGLPEAGVIYTQAGLFDTSTFVLRLSNGVDLTVVCGSGAPSFVSYTASGSSSATGHYANAMALTVNDPNPKFVAPGNQFAGGHTDQLLLHPLNAPMVHSHAYTWPGGDELGWFRDRLTLDGSTPGIDRIFFVARDTTETPNFVDWDGQGFANTTSLSPAAGSIQRLCVTDEGDLIGNDFFGNVYLWDKSAGYARLYLFTFTNDAASVPWGSSLDTALGKIGYDPVSGLILMPVNNSAVSTTGQLYGFDLAGNRVLADQDLMGTTPPGFNSYRFGVTVDLSQPECRVLVHGGRDGGDFFVARFTQAMNQKTVTQVGGGDTHGGWIGALHGSQFFTNTNTASYGLVERALPLDW